MEIRTIRLELEGFAAELAARKISAPEVAQLERLQARFETADTAHASDKAIRLNRDFHFAVYRIAGMEMLTSHIESLLISMGPILYVYYNEVANNYVGAPEHGHLIDALRRKDSRKARAAVKMDILRGGEDLLAYLNEKSAAVAAG